MTGRPPPGHSQLLEAISAVIEERGCVGGAEALAALERLRTSVPSNVGHAESLAAEFERHLQGATGDQHLRISYSPAHFAFLTQQPFVDPSGLRHSPDDYGDAWYSAYEAVNFGVLGCCWEASGTAVLKLGAFGPPGDAVPRLSAALEMCSGARILVIDLRACRGGFLETGLYLLARTLGSDREVFLESFADGRQRVLKTPSMERRVVAPIVVRVDESGFSTVEAVAYALQQMHPQALVVGQSTRGGANAGREVPLIAGYTAFLPECRISLPDKSSWHGCGVQPDVVMTGEDDSLRSLLSELRSETTAFLTPAARRVADWWDRYNSSSVAVVRDVPTEFLRQFVDRSIYADSEGVVWHQIRTWAEPLRVDNNEMLMGTFKNSELLDYQAGDMPSVLDAATGQSRRLRTVLD